MTRNKPVVHGNILKDHYQWLQANAFMDEKGQPRCVATEELMYAQVHHYVRPMGSNVHQPLYRNHGGATAKCYRLRVTNANRCNTGLPVPAEVCGMPT